MISRDLWLTPEKAEALDAEAQLAPRSRFIAWGKVREWLRGRPRDNPTHGAEWVRVLVYVNELQAINGYRPFHIPAAIEHQRERRHSDLKGIPCE